MRFSFLSPRDAISITSSFYAASTLSSKAFRSTCIFCNTSRHAVEFELDELILLRCFLTLSLPMGLSILRGSISSLVASAGQTSSALLGDDKEANQLFHFASFRSMNQQCTNLNWQPTIPSYIYRASLTLSSSLLPLCLPLNFGIETAKA
jgi:hypothetical protein